VETLIGVLDAYGHPSSGQSTSSLTWSSTMSRWLHQYQ
jgi:hypothetical protein